MPFTFWAGLIGGCFLTMASHGTDQLLVQRLLMGFFYRFVAASMSADFRNLEGCNEHLVLTRPDAIQRMHQSYLDAGADLIETDTFGGIRIVECISLETDPRAENTRYLETKKRKMQHMLTRV